MKFRELITMLTANPDVQQLRADQEMGVIALVTFVFASGIIVGGLI